MRNSPYVALADTGGPEDLPRSLRQTEYAGGVWHGERRQRRKREPGHLFAYRSVVTSANGNW